MPQWQEGILTLLENCGPDHVSQDPDRLRIHCRTPNGFEITVQKTRTEFLVSFAGWHEAFDDFQQALDCVAFGLSERCRLKVTLRGSTECAWTVQSREMSKWRDDSTTGLIFVPFWRSKRTEFRQNCGQSHRKD
ncbi:hypothetical protein [Pseudovibrio brasiliensis]|uniref:Uncharacterized protein n=1 Tax=Pseudovibrio brasiliensis TaxID=1898042 RepID=A0ABX8ASL9_9HYPH|nr:hypothetical protein [Pseudovibrio brasiliensis]QUS56186.1 hypothetical protein KGB56_01575 [Pseudovibrio brasiliensis]